MARWSENDTCRIKLEGQGWKILREKRRIASMRESASASATVFFAWRRGDIEIGPVKARESRGMHLRTSEALSGTLLASLAVWLALTAETQPPESPQVFPQLLVVGLLADAILGALAASEPKACSQAHDWEGLPVGAANIRSLQACSCRSGNCCPVEQNITKNPNQPHHKVSGLRSQ